MIPRLATRISKEEIEDKTGSIRRCPLCGSAYWSGDHCEVCRYSCHIAVEVYDVFKTERKNVVKKKGFGFVNKDARKNKYGMCYVCGVNPAQDSVRRTCGAVCTIMSTHSYYMADGSQWFIKTFKECKELAIRRYNKARKRKKRLRLNKEYHE